MITLFGSAELIKNSYKKSVINQKTAEYRYNCNLMSQRFKNKEVSEALTEDLVKEMNWMADYCEGRLILVDSSYKILLDTYSVTQGKYCISNEIIKTFAGNVYQNYSEKYGYIEIAVPIYNDDSRDNAKAVIILSASSSWVAEIISVMNRQITLIEVAGIMILTALSFIFAWVSSAPWKKVAATLYQILNGDLNVTFSLEGGYNETREIIDTFNKILERLRIIDKSRQEFVSNVSHELKTPITSMRVLADSIINEENVPVDIYREFMQDISDEIDREGKIINDLLALVRLDKNATDMNISQIDINNFIEQILKRVRPIAKQREIEIIFESFRPVTAQIDETKLSLAITNIVENGVKYNNDGGWVKISLDADHKYFYITVADSGVGIPEDAKEKIFERFYRVDKARSRETGGTGLGLAITKNVIVLHHGEIKVDSEFGKGTVFKIRIPLKYIA